MQCNVGRKRKLKGIGAKPELGALGSGTDVGSAWLEGLFCISLSTITELAGALFRLFG